MDIKEVMKELKKPFKADEVEWRVQSCGKSSNGPWVKVLTYIDARAIQERLDELFGVNGWKQNYDVYDKKMICKLSIKIDDEWVTKEDGASETNIESFKGGLSSAFKRVAASGFGIGRYLYDLEACFVETCTYERPPYKDRNNWNEAYDSKNKVNIYWKTPKLPSWALPEEETKQPKTTIEPTAEPTAQPKKVIFINREKVVAIKAMVGKHKDLEKQILSSYGLTSTNQITESVYQEIYNKIKTAILKAKKEENSTIFGDKRFIDIIGADAPVTINVKYKGKTPAEIYEIDPDFISNYAKNGYVQHLKAICEKMIAKINEEHKKTS